MDAILVVGVLVIAAMVLWSLTLGRRFFIGRRDDRPSIRRDLYTSSYDEGMYPLDPPRDADDGRRQDE